MKTLTVEVPETLVDAAGSESDAKVLMLKGAVAELVRLGRLTSEQAAEMLGESDEDWVHLAESGGAFDFWLDPAEDIYTEQDGEPL